MIDKDELLNNKDFYKSFKNGEELNSFFKQMHKRAVEHMLEAELDAHLDYEKHEKSKDGNYRNGHDTKKIKTSFGEDSIKVPRDREGSFEPALVPKRHNIIDGLENIIISANRYNVTMWDVMNDFDAYPTDVNQGTKSKIYEFVTMVQSFSAELNKLNAFDGVLHAFFHLQRHIHRIFIRADSNSIGFDIKA